MLMTPKYTYNVQTIQQYCITDVSNWMSRSALKINEDKAEFLHRQNTIHMTRCPYKLARTLYNTTTM